MDENGIAGEHGVDAAERIFLAEVPTPEVNRCLNEARALRAHQ